MKIDRDLSLKLQELYELKPKECYDNMFKLLKEYEIEKQVIGYVKTTGVDLLIRHSWGIVDGVLVEGTLEPNKVEAVYPLIELTIDDWADIVFNRDKVFTDLMDYDREAEVELLYSLARDGVITEDIAMTSLLVNNPHVSELLYNKKYSN